MKCLDIHPASAQQRQMGWEEVLIWDEQSWPSSWEIHPTVNVFAIGARFADVCPVYWDDGQQRGVDWWVLCQQNTPSVGLPLHTDSPAPWQRVGNPDEVAQLFAHWAWDEDCRAQANIQLEGMKAAQASWTALPAQSPVVIVPHSHLWEQWGIQNYNPAVLEHDDAALYHSAARQPGRRPKMV